MQSPQRLADYTREQRQHRQARQFSLARVISEIAEDHGLRDGLEFEICTEAARGQLGGLDRHRPIVPWSVLARDASVAGTGGYFLSEDVAPAVDALRPWSVVVKAGVTVMPNLVGNASIPKISTALTGYWLANEGTQITEGNQTLGQIALSPKTAGAYTEMSRLLQLQSAQADPLVRRDLLRTVGALLDRAVLNGSGISGEPAGVIGLADVNTQSGSSLSQSGVATMKQKCAEGNAPDDALAFVGTPAVRQLLEARERATGLGFIWDNDRVVSPFATTAMQTGSLIVGPWLDVVVGMWGPGFEVAVNRFTNFPAGIVGVACFLTCDVGVRNPAAFCTSTSIT